MVQRFAMGLIALLLPVAVSARVMPYTQKETQRAFERIERRNRHLPKVDLPSSGAENLNLQFVMYV